MAEADLNIVAKLLIGQYSLTEEDCRKVVTDPHLDLLARSCCTAGAWKDLAPYLELERAVVDDIDSKQVDDDKKRSTFFYKWRQIKGSEATYIKLVKALLHIQHKLDAEKLLKQLQPTIGSSRSFSSSSSTDDSCPDPSSLPAGLRKDLRQQLRFSLNDIKTKYGLFVECVRTGMKERGISATELSAFLLSQSVFDYDAEDYKLFSDSKDALERATEVDHIFNLLNTEYASFLNYEIFLTLAQKYSIIQDQTEMNYPQHLEDFINKHKVSEFLEIKPTLLNHNNSSEEITLKLDVKPTCKLAKVKELSEAIADKMKWNPSAVLILDISEGCLAVRLIIPANLADYVFNRDTVFTEKQRKDLLELNVLSVTFNERIYHLKDMQVDHDMPPPSSTAPDHDMPDDDTPPSGSMPPDKDRPDDNMPPRFTPPDPGTSLFSSTTPTKKSDLQWTNYYGRTAFQAGGTRDVLIIVSEDVCGPDVVQRRPAIQLTEEWREKLKNQGITREHQSDDLSLVKARRSFDRTYTNVVKVSNLGRKMTKQRVLEEIETMMKNCKDMDGVVIHYIGAGRRNTGDWCFEDGFITFKDLAHLYLKLLRGRVLSIVTDCSHSGSWVKECVTFLDEQGVKPCGHSARDKGILLSIFTSSRSHEIPRRLAFSLHGCINDQDTNYLFFYGKNTIADEQHSTGINFTDIRCGSEGIAEKCRYLRHATWHEWWKSSSVGK